MSGSVTNNVAGGQRPLLQVPQKKERPDIFGKYLSNNPKEKKEALIKLQKDPVLNIRLAIDKWKHNNPEFVIDLICDLTNIETRTKDFSLNNRNYLTETIPQLGSELEELFTGLKNPEEQVQNWLNNSKKYQELTPEVRHLLFILLQKGRGVSYGPSLDIERLLEAKNPTIAIVTEAEKITKEVEKQAFFYNLIDNLFNSNLENKINHALTIFRAQDPEAANKENFLNLVKTRLGANSKTALELLIAYTIDRISNGKQMTLSQEVECAKQVYSDIENLSRSGFETKGSGLSDISEELVNSLSDEYASVKKHLSRLLLKNTRIGELKDRAVNEWSEISNQGIPFSAYWDAKITPKIQRELRNITTSSVTNFEQLADQFKEIIELIEERHFLEHDVPEEQNEPFKINAEKEINQLKNLQCNHIETQIMAVLFAFQVDKPVCKNNIEDVYRGIVQSLKLLKGKGAGITEDTLNEIIKAVKPDLATGEAITHEWLVQVVLSAIQDVPKPDQTAINQRLDAIKDNLGYSQELEILAIQTGDRRLFYEAQIEKQIETFNKQNKNIKLHKTTRNLTLKNLYILASHMHYVSMPGQFETQEDEKKTDEHFAATLVSIQKRLTHHKDEFVVFIREAADTQVTRERTESEESKYIDCDDISKLADSNMGTELHSTVGEFSHNTLRVEAYYRSGYIHKNNDSNNLIQRLQILAAMNLEVLSTQNAEVYQILDELYQRAVGTGTYTRTAQDMSDGIQDLIQGLETIGAQLRDITTEKYKYMYERYLTWLQMGVDIQTSPISKEFVQKLIAMADTETWDQMLKNLSPDILVGFDRLTDKQKSIKTDWRQSTFGGKLGGKTDRQRWDKVIDRSEDNFKRDWLIDIVKKTGVQSINSQELIDNIIGHNNQDLITKIERNGTLTQNEAERLLLSQHDTHDLLGRVIDLIAQDDAKADRDSESESDQGTHVVSSNRTQPRHSEPVPYQDFKGAQATQLHRLQEKRFPEKLCALRIRKYTKDIQSHLEIFKKLQAYQQLIDDLTLKNELKAFIKTTLKQAFEIEGVEGSNEQKEAFKHLFSLYKIGTAGFTPEKMEDIIGNPEALSASFQTIESSLGIKEISILTNNRGRLLKNLQACRLAVESKINEIESTALQNINNKVHSFLSEQSQITMLHNQLYGVIDSKHQSEILAAISKIEACFLEGSETEGNGPYIKHASLQLVESLRNAFEQSGFEIRKGVREYQLEQDFYPLVAGLLNKEDNSGEPTKDLLKNLKENIEKGYVPNFGFLDSIKDAIFNLNQQTLGNKALRKCYLQEFRELETLHKWYKTIQRDCLAFNESNCTDPTLLLRAAKEIQNIEAKMPVIYAHIQKLKNAFQAARHSPINSKLITPEVACFVTANLNNLESAKNVLDTILSSAKNVQSGDQEYQLYVLHTLLLIAEKHHASLDKVDNKKIQDAFDRLIIKINTENKKAAGSKKKVTDLESYYTRWKALPISKQKNNQNNVLVQTIQARVQGIKKDIENIKTKLSSKQSGSLPLANVLPLMLKLASLEHKRSRKPITTWAEIGEVKYLAYAVLDLLIFQFNRHASQHIQDKNLKFRVLPSWAFETTTDGEKIWTNGFQDIGPMLEHLFQKKFSSENVNISYDNGVVTVSNNVHIDPELDYALPMFIYDMPLPPAAKKQFIEGSIQDMIFVTCGEKIISSKIDGVLTNLLEKSIDKPKNWAEAVQKFESSLSEEEVNLLRSSQSSLEKDYLVEQFQAYFPDSPTFWKARTEESGPQDVRALATHFKTPNPVLISEDSKKASLDILYASHEFRMFLKHLTYDERRLFIAYMEHNPGEGISGFNAYFTNIEYVPNWKNCTLGLMPSIILDRTFQQDRIAFVSKVLAWAYPEKRDTVQDIIKMRLERAREQDVENLKASLDDLQYTFKEYQTDCDELLTSLNSSQITEEQVDKIAKQTKALTRLQNLIPLEVEAEDVVQRFDHLVQTINTIPEKYHERPLFVELNKINEYAKKLKTTISQHIEKARVVSRNPSKYMGREPDIKMYSDDIAAFQELVPKLLKNIDAIQSLDTLNQQITEEIKSADKFSEVGIEEFNQALEKGGKLNWQVMELLNDILDGKDEEDVEVDIQIKVTEWTKSFEEFVEKVNSLKIECQKKIEEIKKALVEITAGDMRDVFQEEIKKAQNAIQHIELADDVTSDAKYPNINNLETLLRSLEALSKVLPVYVSLKKLEEEFVTMSLMCNSEPLAVQKQEAEAALTEIREQITPAILQKLGLDLAPSPESSIVSQNSAQNFNQIHATRQTSGSIVSELTTELNQIEIEMPENSQPHGPLNFEEIQPRIEALCTQRDVLKSSIAQNQAAIKIQTRLRIRLAKKAFQDSQNALVVQQDTQNPENQENQSNAEEPVEI